jgi:nitroimidazol reductase NimA-like FMN-containing flavoprotein (pyridoxamine 5'-phosphate oxidase superfamily)
MTTHSHSDHSADSQFIQASAGYRPQPDRVRKALGKRSFAVLATTSPIGRPHAAAVLYEIVDQALYVNTRRDSRKARNVAANHYVAVSVPIRRLPVGPPSTVQFQGEAEVLDLDSPEILALVADGRLKSITGHGELEEPGGCFLRITFGPRLITYGLGMSIPKLIGDPLHAGGIVELDAATETNRCNQHDPSSS